MTGKLTSKVAIVTGASSGIGEATALALAAEGAMVAIAARRSDRLAALAKRITDQGGTALPITADVSDEAQVNDVVKQTQAKFGRVDILVNNAGVMLLGMIDGANTEDWRRMVNLNVLGLMYATHAVLPLMKAQGIGHIVNISSVAGRVANAGSGVYNATKWAVGAFSEALRKEVYQHNIRVTIIEPGLVATELPHHITDTAAKDRAADFYGSLKNLESEDIANAIAYAVTQPPHVNVNEILIRPTEQER
ncbi:MAG TPA: SDR family NAD(P)-dependent oxidoreductase [Crinalium sp.]|jgi:NADP-dependent 3-hydroxy acid dehydrogenase YdfG